MGKLYCCKDYSQLFGASEDDYFVAFDNTDAKCTNLPYQKCMLYDSHVYILATSPTRENPY